MVDTAARANLRVTIDEFLNEKIKANEFDTRLQDIAERTEDKTVREVVQLLWTTYDDFEDHPVILNKVAWDVIQRVMLALESGAEFTIDEGYHRVFHPSQLLALVTIIVIPFLLPSQVFFGWFIMVCISIGISKWREKIEQRADDGLWPFRSISQIRFALKRSPDFKKKRYRPEIGKRLIRPYWFERFTELPLYFLWWFLAPFILLYQCFPIKIGDASKSNIVYDNQKRFAIF